MVTARDRFLATYRDGRRECAPPYEDLRGEIVEGWGGWDALAPLGLDRWHLTGPGTYDLAGTVGLGRVVDSPAAADEWLALNPPATEAAPLPCPVDPARAEPRGFDCYAGLLLTCGVEDGQSLDALAIFLADEPGLVESIMGRLAERHELLLRQARAQADFDYLHFSEPIASHHGPVIGPAMFRRYVLPYYARLIGVARELEIPLVMWESWGQVELLLPLLVEVGVDIFCLRHSWGAGLDLRDVRRRLPEVGLLGGVDRRWLRLSDDEMTAALRAVVPELLASGRYVPMLDDRPRPDMDLATFVAYRERLNALLPPPA